MAKPALTRGHGSKPTATRRQWQAAGAGGASLSRPPSSAPIYPAVPMRPVLAGEAQAPLAAGLSGRGPAAAPCPFFGVLAGVACAGRHLPAALSVSPLQRRPQAVRLVLDRAGPMERSDKDALRRAAQRESLRPSLGPAPGPTLILSSASKSGSGLWIGPNPVGPGAGSVSARRLGAQAGTAVPGQVSAAVRDHCGWQPEAACVMVPGARYRPIDAHWL